VWAKLIRNVTARMIGPDDSFFDLGGHSILAQQMFFELRRKWRGIDISMNVIFRSPTLKGFAGEIDRLLALASFATSDDKTLAGAVQAANEPDDEYSKDAVQLASQLPETFPTRTDAMLTAEPLVFLTGATGFLGAHILRDLLTRKAPSTKVVALVRAKTEEQALERIRGTCRAYGFWDEAWTSKLRAVCGDLGKPQFGLTQAVWDDLTSTVDTVIHNGALVHWVYPYATLKPANVMGTIDALKLCSGKAKQFAFVSSTSALDKDYFVEESERIIAAGGNGISEDDDMEGSRIGLGTGYGQTKWAGEYLVKEASRRGLKTSIIRSGYVLGDSITGTTNNDDFLVRFLLGCIQLSARPNINNTVNMVPVDHVARIVIACAFNPVGVAHVTGHPRLRFNEFLGALELYGYNVPQVDYIPWSNALEKYVNDGQHDDKESQHALLPLYHFVTADLPSNTKAPELDDVNAAAALRADAAWSGVDASAGAGVTEELVGLYASYLFQTGFLPAPTIAGARPLPPVQISDEQKKTLLNVGGRGGTA
jgi:L-aminoadipate-semialdehyde dehydrogenase